MDATIMGYIWVILDLGFRVIGGYTGVHRDFRGEDEVRLWGLRLAARKAHYELRVGLHT